MSKDQPSKRSTRVGGGFMQKGGFWPPFYRRKGQTKGSPSHRGQGGLQASHAAVWDGPTALSPPYPTLGGVKGVKSPLFFIIFGPFFLLFSPYSALNERWSGMGVNKSIFDFPRIYTIFLHLYMIFLAFIDPFWHLFAYFWSNHLGFHQTLHLYPMMDVRGTL